MSNSNSHLALNWFHNDKARVQGGMPPRIHPAELVPRKPNIFFVWQRTPELMRRDDGTIEIDLFVDEYDDARVGDAVVITFNDDVIARGRINKLLAAREPRFESRISTYWVAVATSDQDSLQTDGDEIRAQVRDTLRDIGQSVWGTVGARPGGFHAPGGIAPNRAAALQLLHKIQAAITSCAGASCTAS